MAKEKEDAAKRADLSKLSTLQKEYDKLKVDVPHEADGTKQRVLLTRKGEVTREMDVIKRKHDLQPEELAELNRPAEDGKPGAPAEQSPVTDDDPVAEMNVDKAVESVNRMRSREKVQAVIDNDSRVTVVNAAKERLKSL
jgi:hypothetical protein